MENPQAQMPQGQPGMEQGQAPQQGGQDQQMQQLMQAVQQMIQQGAQPTDVAAQLLGQQVPPEVIMQVFVQMGLPEQEAQMAIEQAMQGGQQQQGPGEEQMEGAASNPQEEAAEQGMAPAPEGQGMAPEGQPQMAFGGFFSGNSARRLKNKKNVIINNYTVNGTPEDFASLSSGASLPDAEETGEDVYYNPGLRTSVGNAMFPQGGNAYTPPMAYGGNLRRYENGSAVDPQQELQSVMEQVQGMMEQGADARQVMEQIQAAAQQGEISPEVATQVMEQLSGMQQAQNPQGSDMAMADQSQDPQQMDPNVAAPEAQMMRFGGNLKKLMKKAYGGEAISPNPDSKTYVKDRANMFVNSVKNNAFKSTLDDEFPSLSGNQMAYGGNLPKAGNGIEMKDGKLVIDPTQYKSESEYKAAVYDWNTNPANKDNQVTTDMFSQNKWTEQPDQNASYKYDPTTKQYVKQVPAQTNTQNQFQFKQGDVLNYDNQGAYITRQDGTMQRVPANFGQTGYNVSQSAINPVAYQNPLGNTLYDNLYASANPWARLIAGSGNRMVDPRITGANLPGGMSGAQFLGNVGGLNGLTTGMTGKIGDQTWRVTGAEKFKEGSIWKGNRRKGVRYNIDWGTEGAANPAGPQNNPATTTTNNNPATTTTTSPQGSLSTMTRTGGSGMGAMEQFDEDLTSVPTVTNNTSSSNNPTVTNNTNAPVTTRTGGSGMGMLEGEEDFPSLTVPNASVTANQNLVAPGKSDVIQPSTEVDPALQKMAGKAGFTNPGGDFVGNQPVVNTPVVNKPVVNQNPALYPDEDESLYPSMKRYGGKIYRAMGGSSECPEGMVWSEADQACVPIANVPETKPLDASIAVGENNQFSANYSGTVGPNGIATNNIGFGYNPNENTSLKGNYDAANQSIMLQGKKTWDTKNGQFGVSGGYTAPVGGDNRFNQGNFNGNVFYNTQLGRGENAVPVKVNVGFGQQAYGGNVNPADLANAVALINRAFGGMMPRANNGLDLGSEDTDANNIPDYLQAENLPANQPSNLNNKGTLESSAGKKFNVNWDAAADVYATSGAKFANFMDKVSSYQGNQERELAKRSALNRPSDTYDQMEQGVYDQWGNFKPNDLNNQVLNPTDVYRQNQRQVYAYGGRLYEIGGEVDLDDSELEALRMAGFNFRRS